MAKKKSPPRSRTTTVKRTAVRSTGEREYHWWTYEDLERLSGKNLDTLYQHRSRGNLDPGDLESVLIWVARHGKPEVRQAIIEAALAPVRTGPKAKSKASQKS